jgi:hypothetical protein
MATIGWLKIGLTPDVGQLAKGLAESARSGATGRTISPRVDTSSQSSRLPRREPYQPPRMRPRKPATKP